MRYSKKSEIFLYILYVLSIRINYVWLLMFHHYSTETIKNDENENKISSIHLSRHFVGYEKPKNGRNLVLISK